MSKNILVDEAADPADQPQTVEEEVTAQNEQVTEDTAGAQTEDTTEAPEVPKKLQGKSFEEVVAMYQNLEREYGRQANEVGTYRDLVATLSDVKRKQDLAEAEATDSNSEVTADDLFEDPNAAVRRILERELAPLKQSQQQMSHRAELDQLIRDYPNLEQIGADPDFIAFVERSPYRVADANRWIQTQDVQAARRLITDWEEAGGKAKADQAEAPKPDKPARGNVSAARQATTEAGGSADRSGKRLLYERDVIKVLQTDPDRYHSPDFQAELHAAVKEGRFRK